VLIVALPLCWLAKERRQSVYEVQLADTLRQRGFPRVTLGGPWDTYDLYGTRISHGWVRDLAHKVLGERIYQVDGREPIHPKRESAISSKVRAFADLSQLAWLTNLQILVLESTLVSDIAPLARHSHLKYLFLDSTNVSDLTPLAGLKELRWLSFSNTQVVDLLPLVQLINMERLWISETNVHDLKPLVDMTRLEYFSVIRTKATKAEIQALQTALPKCQFYH